MVKDDKAFVLTNSKQVDRTLSIFGKEEKLAKTILIIGAGNIGLDLAKMLEENEQKPRVKIIEKNPERAEFAANELNETIVVKGDGLDENLLQEINIDEIDTVLSLTDDDENNKIGRASCRERV